MATEEKEKNGKPDTDLKEKVPAQTVESPIDRIEKEKIATGDNLEGKEKKDEGKKDDSKKEEPKDSKDASAKDEGKSRRGFHSDHAEPDLRLSCAGARRQGDEARHERGRRHQIHRQSRFDRAGASAVGSGDEAKIEDGGWRIAKPAPTSCQPPSSLR